MSKFGKPRELRVSLHCSPFALASKASQKRLERIRADVWALRAENGKGEYEVGTVCYCDKGAGKCEWERFD